MNTLQTKQKRSVLAAVLAALSGVCIFVGALSVKDASIKQAAGEIAVEMGQELSAEYAFGDVFTLPACTFTKDGKSAQAVASLQYPDGTQTGKAEVTLNQGGNYVLRYLAKIDEKVYTQEYSFKVYGRLASYESEKTSMEYGLCTHLGANSEGLMVRIANGDSLTFDHVFDMTKMTIATKLLEGFVVPNVAGSADFTRMVFTFTDIEDPSVQLVYNGNFHNDANAYGLTYFTAAGNGQLQTGLEKAGTLHVGTTLGCMVPHSFVAKDTGLYWGAQKPVDAAPDAKTFCISYDYKSNQAWAGGKFVSDLDDSNYYSSLWFGFPSGKAKLTISALNYNDATANMCFTSILGVDLSAKKYIDDEVPVISVDNSYETMPNALVGGSYPVPTATALDRVSGESDVNVSVWKNYGTASQTMVNIQDGKFAVDQVGTYAIVYEAQDYTGNTAREVLWVRASLSQYLPKLKISIDDAPTQIEVGTLQSLPQTTVSGGCGNVNVTYSLTNGENTCDIVDGYFRIEQAGDWVLTCTATDYVGNQAKKQCVIQGVASGKPVLHQTPTLPMGYVSGAAYTLPLLYAYDYTGGEKKQSICDVAVTYNGNTSTYQAGKQFTPTVENDKDLIKIAYVSGGTSLFEQEIPVRVVLSKELIPGSSERYRDAVNVEKYFYSNDDLTVVNHCALGEYQGIQISANSAAESAKAHFINAQLANTFSLSFLTVPSQSKFTHINVTLTDSENSAVSVQATLRKGEGKTHFIVGDTSIELDVDFNGAQATPFIIGYTKGAFVVNASTSVNVAKTQTGEAFNGFPSGKVYFDIELCNAQANDAVFLHQICGINASNTRDNTGPSLEWAKEVSTTAVKDSVYTLQKIIACDVLSPNVKTSLTVVAPNGAPAVSVDGVTLENVDATKGYQIQLSEYGEYLISVVGQESSTWKFSTKSYADYTLSVIDGEKPTLTFDGEFQTQLSVGELLIIPNYTVSDNFTKAEDIHVIKMIINPKGMPVYLDATSNALKCEYAGVYKIYFYVYDQMGNLTIFQTSVTVK